MSDPLQVIVDWRGERLEVGSFVTCGEGLGKVKSISDYDCDAGDDARPRVIAPQVTVLWPDETIAGGFVDEQFGTRWMSRGWWDESAPWECADLELVTTPSEQLLVLFAAEQESRREDAETVEAIER